MYKESLVNKLNKKESSFKEQNWDRVAENNIPIDVSQFKSKSIWKPFFGDSARDLLNDGKEKD